MPACLGDNNLSLSGLLMKDPVFPKPVIETLRGFFSSGTADVAQGASRLGEAWPSSAGIRTGCTFFFLSIAYQLSPGRSVLHAAFRPLIRAVVNSAIL